MGTSEIITSKQENYKKLKLKKSGQSLPKFGTGKSVLKIGCLSDTHQNHKNMMNINVY